MRSIVVAVVLSSLTFPLLARSNPQSPPVPTAEASTWIHLNGAVQDAAKRGVTTNLWEAASNEGESIDQFVTRIGRDALLVLEASPATICGQFADKGGKHSVMMKTTSKAADCSVAGSNHPYILVKGSEPGAEKVGPFQNELRGPTYVVTPSGVKFVEGKSSRSVANYSKK